MSRTKEKYAYGWTDLSSMHDPRMPRFDFWFYEVRYAFNPDGYQVVKQHLVHQDFVQVLASGLTLEAAEGFIKLLKEYV